MIRKSKLFSLICLLSISFTGFAENQSLLIATNNTEIPSPGLENFSEEASQLQNVLDTYFKDQNITVRVQFIDPAPYPDYIQWLVDWWAETFPEEDPPQDIEILFSKAEKSNQWLYEGIKIENRTLKEKHLLPKVMTYVEEHIIREGDDEKQIVKKWLKTLAQALDQRWKNNLLANAKAMATNPRYIRGNSVIDNNIYYEFVPNHLDSLDSTNLTYIVKPAEINKGFHSGANKENLDDIIGILEQTNNHHEDKIVSDWLWSYNKSLKKWTLRFDNTYHLKNNDTCKLNMVIKSTDKGEPMPNMLWRQVNGATWTKPPTYCNYFAQALACLVFEKGAYDPVSAPNVIVPWYPWVGQKTANEIHDYMVAHPELFVDLEWQDCWEYINAGYIVYFVHNNAPYAGHIATGYPTSESELKIDNDLNGYQVGKIAQAGARTGIFQMEKNEPWSASKITSVRTFLYLGNLYTNL